MALISQASHSLRSMLMSTSEKHPHLDGASEEQIVALLQEQDPSLRSLYLETHRLVLQTLPDIKHATDCVDGGTGYGARQYGYDGWGMAALIAHKSWISLVFFRGTDLQDPAGLLVGSGKQVRHIKLGSLDQLEQQRSEIRTLLLRASRLNS
jgi:hypothetical protein